MFTENDFRPSIGPADVLKQVSQEEIYSRLCVDFPSKVCHSPFRIDNTPSFGFYLSGTTWMWADLGKYRDSGDVFKFAKRMFIEVHGMPIKNFQDVLYGVLELFEIELSNENIYESQLNRAKKRKIDRADIKLIARHWEKEDFLLWKRWAITSATLQKYNVHPARQVYSDDLLVWRHLPANPIYGYYFPKTNRLKCYKPLEPNKKKKFLSNCTNDNEVQGYDQLDLKNRKYKVIIITKAMKEVMFLNEFGIASVAGHNEGSGFKPEFIAHLRKHCRLLVSLYDNDNAGFIAAKKLEEQHDIPCAFVPRQLRRKNVTDLWETNPIEFLKLIEEFKRWIQQPLFKTHYKPIIR